MQERQVDINEAAKEKRSGDLFHDVSKARSRIYIHLQGIMV